MLFNKANLKILQDLDDRGPTSKRTTKMEDKLSFKTTSNIPDKNNGDLLKTSCKKCEEANLLKHEIIKLQSEKMTLLMKLKTKGQELQKVKEEKNYQFDHLLHTEKIVNNLQKDIETQEQIKTKR
ncbi:hypothetical protein AVEN_231431-1 [Araneus ventricosus]|uniref:Uncharacterized protein n=1 Tax=Araneus ventricosus TaxID=182803 RepID=A0A4Y2TZV8_ARAVE|nr:hypothetical protein AVEN_231431-1 [Araneus ventricosus]